MNLNKKTSLFKKATALALLLTFGQGSIAFAYDPYGTSFRGSAQTNTIVDMYSADQGDVSTLRLNGSARITNSKTKISLSLRDSDVQQVLRMLSDKAGLNIVFHESLNQDTATAGSGSMGGQKQKKITMDLVNTTVNDAFMLVLEATALSYYLDSNTIIVAPKTEIAKMSFSRQNLTTLPVKYVEAKGVADFLNTNVFSSQITGLSNQNIVTVNPRTNEIMIFGSRSDVEVASRVLAKLDTRPMVNTFKVNHTTPKEMAELICASIVGPGNGKNEGGSSGGSSGGGSGKQSSMNFSMITPFDGAITGAAAGGNYGGGTSSEEIKEVSLGGGQIACKSAEVVAASTNVTSGGFGAANDKAPDPISFASPPMSVAYFPQVGTISVYGGSVHQIEAIKEFIASNDKKQLMAYLEMSVIELNEKGSKDFQTSWNMSTPYGSMGFSPGGGVKISTIKLFEDAGGFNFFPSHGGSSSVTASAISYVVSSGNGRVLSNPKIMITNGQKSVIDLSEDYIKTIKTEMSMMMSGTQSVPIVTRTIEVADDAGFKIELMPFISLDGYVTLNINPNYATIKDQKMLPVSTGMGQTENELAATLLQRRNLELKNLRIKDGETLVIGGMVREDEKQQVEKVPILGDLPLIGVLFRNTSNKKEKAELVIMITPHIIYDDEQLANVKKENL